MLMATTAERSAVAQFPLNIGGSMGQQYVTLCKTFCQEW
jgi:hypothetical protein